MPAEDLWKDAETIYDFLAQAPALPEYADLILAAGTYDLRVADHAAKLYLEGCAALIVCSGGFGKVTTRLFNKPEAELFRDHCIELGVPESAVLAESKSTNTGENFRLSHQMLSEMGMEPKTGIIASKPYMVKRAWATGTKQWPEVVWFSSAAALPFREYLTESITFEDTVQLMVGDLQRLEVYEKQGYQAHVDVPESIWTAYERLVSNGFDRYVIRSQKKSSFFCCTGRMFGRC